MVFSRLFFGVLALSVFAVAACTSSREVKEATQPQDEPAPMDMEEAMPSESPAPEMEADQYSDDADLEESGDESFSEPDAATGAAEDAGGKGGIISSGVKKKKNPCASIKNPRQRQRCLERLKQKP